MQNTNQNKKIKVGIIGATGYDGAELVRLLLSYPCAELTALGSVSYEAVSYTHLLQKIIKRFLWIG